MEFLLPGFAAIALYLSSAIGLGRLLKQGISCNLNRRILFRVTGTTGLLLHGIVLWMLVVQQWVNLGFFHSLSFASWLLVLLLQLAWLIRPVGNLGVVIFPIAAVTLALQLFNADAPVVSHTPSVFLDSHILLSMLAYNLLGIAALQAILLAVQEWHFRHKHPGGFMRALPPMAEVEQLMFQVIRIGLLLLTLSLLSGFLFFEDLFAQNLAHKTILSLIAWLIFAALLWGRWRYGWRGRTAIGWTLSGFGVLLIAYFGSKFVLEILLATSA